MTRLLIALALAAVVVLVVLDLVYGGWYTGPLPFLVVTLGGLVVIVVGGVIGG